jgi:hypothetical protein
LPQQRSKLRDGAPGGYLVAVLAGILASGLGVSSMAPLLVRALVAGGSTESAAEMAVRMAGRLPGAGGVAGEGPALHDAMESRSMWRAAYLVSASRRLTQAMTEARSTGKTPIGQLRVAMESERRYLAQQFAANKARLNAAAHVDKAAQLHGPTLGWYLGQAEAHTPECVAAAGHNFSATRQPRIGWPGSVHGGCGCHAGAPIPGAGAVDEATRGMEGD